MTRVDGAWLRDSGTQAIFAMLENGGYQAWVVGGCVRNALLGQPVTDVDFTTDTLPEQVMELAQTAGLRAIPTGISHGTVTVVSQGDGFEITTFRRDVRTDGRHAQVAFARTMQEDAHRRDFTINALYADRDGNVRDPLGGLADIRAGRVRFIDDPHARIREDYLRILRFFRFHAWYGNPENGIDAEALAACATHADGIDNLSHERIGNEMRKLLAAPDPAPSLASMQGSGVLHHVLPGASTALLAVLVHLEQQMEEPPRWLRRLACIDGNDARDRLRLTRAEARYLRNLQQGADSDTTVSEFAYRLGAEAAIDVALLRAATRGIPLPEGLREIAEHAAGQRFPLRGSDITSGESGPALGRKLKRLERMWIDSGFTLGRDELLRK